MKKQTNVMIISCLLHMVPFPTTYKVSLWLILSEWKFVWMVDIRTSTSIVDQMGFLQMVGAVRFELDSDTRNFAEISPTRIDFFVFS